MKKEELINLGFKDTSSPDDMIFNDYTYSTPDLKINVYGDNIVDIYLGGTWNEVPNCKAIDDLKQLIKLFTP